MHDTTTVFARSFAVSGCVRGRNHNRNEYDFLNPEKSDQEMKSEMKSVSSALWSIFLALLPISVN